MLGLTLRDEFRGKRLKGTAIELSNDSNTGATQIAAQAFLEITYPTHDLLKGIEAVGPNQGRPVVVIGERGLGKSHLMAALYHAVNDPASTGAWLNSWSSTLGDPSIGKIALRDGMLVIGESLHRQRYKFLWDLLFERHPRGEFIKGKWEGMGSAKTDIPSDKLIIELLEHRPAMLLLDEFQTWYDGLTNTKQYPWKQWAFNFIQILSEIAKERPDLLVLVISVRNGGSDAYQQVHRVNPVAIDFKAGGNAERIQQDRRRMLLHRLFDNRLQIADGTIESLVAQHVSEYFRLLDVPPAEQDRKRHEFTESWPYAPHLLRLLEEQVLIATDAQETRDMIRILANLYKSRGEAVPVLTAADFRLDDDASGIGALLDSVSNEHHRTLREKAQHNIISVTEAVYDHANLAPHLQEILSALWLRSIAVGNLAGADPATLQVDITRNKPVDGNAFQVELATIVENSFNIHQEGPRLVFREEENPRAKLMACARNDKLFTDGSDQAQLARQVRYVIGGSEDAAGKFRVIALPKTWQTSPWSTIDEGEHPDQWDDRLLPILVLPEDPEKIDQTMGRWLKDHLQKRRNTIRFLLPRAGSTNAFLDRDLLILARAEMKAQEWSGQNPEYKRLHKEFESTLRENLKKRFDRFSVLHRYDHQNPQQSLFSTEHLKKQGAQIPEGIEETLTNDLFVPEDFEDLVLEAASENAPLGKLLRELQEPRPAGQNCIPWLGETAMKERILRLCARGKIAINLRNLEQLQTQAGEDEDSAWRRLRPKLSYTGRQLDEVFLMEPSAVSATGGTTPPAPQPSAGGNGGMGGDIFGSGTTSATGVQEPQPGTTSTPAGIFGDTSSGAKPRIPLSNPPTSPLNLIGKLEGWGIGPASPVHEVRLASIGSANGRLVDALKIVGEASSEVTIKVSSATGAQIKELLKKLPDGMTFELSLEKEDN
ncbi:DUF499 domain-containing protein [Xanthomonas arboricola pv. juglandis]|uniref:DUF499 domain-containing protein n=1 Tax=Xanthomonas arboricola TaxID=56448 RepID=UPI0025B10852|nr:DUF499 domain-containing protein [Xanthomonas arboricola]MDN0241531.1 DUF499 domain-containing protein [Xanthomonas arboricola pv. juglandis]MDN0254238.1 DUF499 domain-containing protein [Xanthomonas arboricola pv. juglandis]MDN0258139.1 DUF499 domain-containing protein [Xanthomonas arboricola pv. juglandis]MDN0261942.1 DUF499 domain-containing protein [Xanthomonas arboricola pv. juglandis]